MKASWWSLVVAVTFAVITGFLFTQLTSQVGSILGAVAAGVATVIYLRMWVQDRRSEAKERAAAIIEASASSVQAPQADVM